jgi:AbrB family looped-hinge helix DNA binding protein
MKRHTATVSSKSQIVLPREVRDRLGVKMGDEVEFVFDDSGIHVLPVRDKKSFDAWLGAAPSTENTAQFEGNTRHAGLSGAELAVLRAGPGAKVVRLNADEPDT